MPMSTQHTEAVASDRPKHSVTAMIAGWVGLLGHLATLVWYMASGLVAPGWAVITLLVIWLGLLGLAPGLGAGRAGPVGAHLVRGDLGR
jgi:hypothetical protein